MLSMEVPMASRSLASSSGGSPAASADDSVADARRSMSSSLLLSEPVSLDLDPMDLGTEERVLKSPDTLAMSSTVPDRLSKSVPESRRTTETSAMNFFFAPPLKSIFPLASCQFLRMSYLPLKS